MNIETATLVDNKVNWLFIDINSFFASCEQQDRPELRGRPIAVVQMETDSTCAIAASYEAKRFGIKTGIKIGDAKKLCPDLVLVKARHRMYVDYHHRIIEAVETCLPVEKVCSIDEVACRLIGTERDVAEARKLAVKVKNTIRSHVGDCMKCSVGLGPSLFLGKVGSDMQKPDGLTIITKQALPDILDRLKLTDIYGIGRRMEGRFNAVGISTVPELMQASRATLRRVWGGVTGVLYYELLHGADLQFPSSPESHSISHQHVLEPALRTTEGARQFAQHLLAKAAERLRNKDYFARRLGLFISWAQDQGRWWDEVGFHETQNTAYLLPRLNELWHNVPLYKPIKIGVVLFGLVPSARHQPDLFANSAVGNISAVPTKLAVPASGPADTLRRQRLSPILDHINSRYGRGAITFGLHDPQVARFTGHAAFQRVPEAWEF